MLGVLLQYLKYTTASLRLQHKRFYRFRPVDRQELSTSLRASIVRFYRPAQVHSSLLFASALRIVRPYRRVKVDRRGLSGGQPSTDPGGADVNVGFFRARKHSGYALSYAISAAHSVTIESVVYYENE